MVFRSKGITYIENAGEQSAVSSVRTYEEEERGRGKLHTEELYNFFHLIVLE
jgi:hypothetical protein